MAITDYGKDVFDPDYSYDIQIEVYDYFETVTYQFRLPTSFTLIDFRNTGKGIAFGKASEADKFECALDAEFSGDFALTQPLPISEGGTGATAAAAALTNLGAMPLYPNSIRFQPTPSSGHGGHIDFYYNNGAAMTSRIIEEVAGRITVGANLAVSQNIVTGFGHQITPHTSYAGLTFAGGSAAPITECKPSVDNKMHLGVPGSRFMDVYAAGGVKTSSDSRLKKNISADFTALAKVFAKLRPVTYEYADIDDGLTRIGFIAQEVETAMAEEGLNAGDYAFLAKDEIDPECDMAKFIGDTRVYSLNYSEFVALNTYMIQTLQKENEELKERLDKIEERLEALKEVVK